jgi:tRNA 2-thiouridine synthesizing protein B
MLHIVNKSPFERNSFESCVNHAVAGSTILLIEDGVYAAIANTSASAMMDKAKSVAKVVVLASDAEARGIHEKLDSGIETTDYASFVDLVTESDRVQSWL